MSEREERACETEDLVRDYVGYGREYRGHNGSCGNCGKEYSESADEDLSDAHWIHTIESGRAHWETATPDDVKALALALDPDDSKVTNRAPHRATEFATNLLTSDWLAARDARIREEALKPVRALHQPIDCDMPYHGGRHCVHCNHKWPCPTYRAVIDTPTQAQEVCTTPGCNGDGRSAPGRGYRDDCHYPLDTPAQATTHEQCANPECRRCWGPNLLDTPAQADGGEVG